MTDAMSPRDRLIETLKRIDDGNFPSLDDQADAILTALASSGDHTELIGVLRADRLPECSFDDGRTWELDGVGVAEIFSRAADALETLIAEVPALQERIERLNREADETTLIAYQAAEAERKLAKAEELLGELAEGRAQKNNINEYDDLSTRASTFLFGKEAKS